MICRSLSCYLIGIRFGPNSHDTVELSDINNLEINISIDHFSYLKVNHPMRSMNAQIRSNFQSPTL